MATTAEIIDAALRKIAVTSNSEAATAEDAGEALTALNQMLHGWKLRSVDVSHSDLEMTTTFPLANEYHEGVVYLLASRLSPNFIVPASFDADDWFRAIQASYTTSQTVTMPSALKKTPSQRKVYRL